MSGDYQSYTHEWYEDYPDESPWEWEPDNLFINSFVSGAALVVTYNNGWPDLKQHANDPAVSFHFIGGTTDDPPPPVKGPAIWDTPA